MKCTFCGDRIEIGSGKIIVGKTGKLQYFCSSKCEKNMLKLKRKALSTRWTSAARKAKEVRGKSS